MVLTLPSHRRNVFSNLDVLRRVSFIDRLGSQHCNTQPCFSIEVYEWRANPEQHYVGGLEDWPVKYSICQEVLQISFQHGSVPSYSDLGGAPVDAARLHRYLHW